ncbi:hypothetical protein Glove_122g78 [Diversispora epigaea]|uniref:Uncharacterized protein n=1 Tax=Diversispora epigaea TaxID=1348612 RepID=A0A397J1L9_9GLOM|nr:hypothetical protein Glove_122g78 [Diversispora epigaea]
MILNEIDKTKDWEEHLVHILKSCQVYYKRKIKENKYDEIVSNDMLALLSADSEDIINKLFDNILKNNKNTTIPNNTNIAEVAHALSNRHEKNLKLITAIKQGYKLDKERLIVINNNNKYNIPFRGRDKGSIARKVSSNKCQANKLIKKVKTTFSKRKQNENASSSKKKLKKTITIESDIEDNQNEDNQDQENIEFQEKVMALKERQLTLREREAKIREIELNNLIKEKELNNN